jgi:hypothetical protein
VKIFQKEARFGFGVFGEQINIFSIFSIGFSIWGLWVFHSSFSNLVPLRTRPSGPQLLKNRGYLTAEVIKFYKH